MGTREESVAGHVVRGYAGKIRPNQAEGGLCTECGELVYVDAHVAPHKMTVDRVTFIHLGCEPLPPSSGAPNVIGGDRG